MNMRTQNKRYQIIKDLFVEYHMTAKEIKKHLEAFHAHLLNNRQITEERVRQIMRAIEQERLEEYVQK